MVYSTQYSFEQTIDNIFAGFGYEVEIDFEQLQRIDEVIPLIESRPNVKNAEMWVFRTANAKVPGASGPGSEYEVFVRGVPSESPIFKPQLTAGRMLDPMDERAILLNQKLAGKMGVGVGDEIIIDLPDVGETRWTIVGLVFDLNGRDQNTAFANIDTLNLALRNVGRAAVAMVQGTDQSLATQQAIEADLIAFFNAKGMKIGYSDSCHRRPQQCQRPVQHPDPTPDDDDHPDGCRWQHGSIRHALHQRDRAPARDRRDARSGCFFTRRWFRFYR